MRVGLALHCSIQTHNVFARKNYFYPDLPKSYQISQYELPLALNGWLDVVLAQGHTKRIGIRRVHLEEDTGKLTHMGRGDPRAGDPAVSSDQGSASLVDYNRSGVPLLEIVSEPDIRSGDEARSFAIQVRQILRYLEVNSGDMEKGVFRVEPNISLRPIGAKTFGTRTELKNLNSFRALADGTAYELKRQMAILDAGGQVAQETRGWHESRRETFSQRRKEEADDYRYFPDPDLPPLKITSEWIEQVRAGLPELPGAKVSRYRRDFDLSNYDANVIAEERVVAEWFDAAVRSGGEPKRVANWMINELFRLMNESNVTIPDIQVTPVALVELISLADEGVINNNTAKDVLAEMFVSGQSARSIVQARGLSQITDQATISAIIDGIIADHPDQVAAYAGGRTQLYGWFVGQVMKATQGKANPSLVNQLLSEQLNRLSDA
jgi:aspartyl-tRNA(Asn)/glutamyl-tRNA(Gln) amidotransferase subunit B